MSGVVASSGSLRPGPGGITRLDRIEAAVLAGLLEAGRELTPRQLAELDLGLSVFAAERGCERLADQRLVERSEWSFGYGPRSYALTLTGTRVAARRDMAVAA